MQYVEETIEKHEENVSQNLPELINQHLQIITNSYNLAVYVLSQFSGKPLVDLNNRLKISLVMTARIANDLRCITHTSRFGYGTQSCAIAANIWELVWQLVWVTRTQAEADEWLKVKHFTSGGPDPNKCLVKYLKEKGVPDYENQAKTERAVYGKLCALKHGNPRSFSFHAVDDWQDTGTVRLGPDLSEFGQKAICFASFMAAQLTELALQEVAQNHLAQDKNFLYALKEKTEERQKIFEITNKKWTSFP